MVIPGSTGGVRREASLKSDAQAADPISVLPLVLAQNDNLAPNHERGGFGSLSPASHRKRNRHNSPADGCHHPPKSQPLG
jgi:hypothetical protein